MRMEDVDENEMIEQPKRTRKVEQTISNDELIRKTIETMNTEQIKKAQIRPSVRDDMVDMIKGMQADPSTSPNYWELKGLPSKYLLYPKGTVILGRPLKVLEVKKLASINEQNADFIINDILRRAIKGINIDDILTPDKLFLVLWLRSNTYRDSGYVVDYKCTNCQKESNYHFEIEQLETQYLSDDYDPNKTLKLRSGDMIKLKFLTIGDETAISRFKEINSKAIGDIDDELLSLAKMIVSINGEEKSLIEKYHYITDMEPGDFSYISSYLEKYGMGIKPYMNVKCDNCGGNSQVGITFLHDFWFPQYKFE